MRKALRISLSIFGLLLLIAVAGFVIWGMTPSGPMPEATAALLSGSQVTVEKTDVGLVFEPVGSQPTTGLIIYPGGHVDYRAYAPTASQIAAQGYLVVIVPMPLNLAVLNANAAADVIAAYPEIEYWAVGGHSLGGAMAANFAKKNPDQVDGLVLWASYPASSDDLTGSGLRVASIYGTLDGLATGMEIDASRALLPVDTTWVPIEGGNHAQNGWYGVQSGDNAATISRQEQQTQIVAATVALLENLQ
jgi:predicted alpha/beta-hydrolase family hydrolase